MHADAPDRPELEEALQQHVVAGVEVEARTRRCGAPAARSGWACLTARDPLDLGEARDRLGLDVDDDAARDVVGDQRPVGRARRSPRSGRRSRPAAACCSRASRSGTRRRRARARARSARPSARSRRCRCRRRRSRARRPPRSPPRRARAARRRRASGSRRSSPRRRARRSRSSTRCCGEPLEGVEVDAAVVAERRHDRGQDSAEHAAILDARRPSRRGRFARPALGAAGLRAACSSPTVSPGGQLGEPRERELDAGDERLARARVVADRQRLARRRRR